MLDVSASRRRRRRNSIRAAVPMMPMTRPGMKPAAKSRPEKPLLGTGVGVALTGLLVPVGLFAKLIEDVGGGAVALLELADGVAACLVESSI